MKTYQTLTTCVGIVCAVVSGYQALVIAQVGVSNQIPQLQGDGGGGMLSACLCLLAALFCLVKPLIAGIIFALSAVVAVVCGVIYADTVLPLWGLGSLVLAIAILLIRHRMTQRARVSVVVR